MAEVSRMNAYFHVQSGDWVLTGSLLLQASYVNPTIKQFFNTKVKNRRIQLREEMRFL